MEAEGLGNGSGSQPGSVSASTEINAPNLNSEKHSLMVPHGICVQALPFSLFIYLF